MKRETDCIKNKIIRHTKKCFYFLLPTASCLVKLFQKFSSSMLETEWWEKKKYGHTFSKMPKNFVSNFRHFLFGVWSLVFSPMEMWVWFFFFIFYYLCIHTKIEKVCSGMWSQARVVFRGIQGIWVEKEVFQCCVTFHPNN